MTVFTTLTYADVLDEERARVLWEANHCHGPGSGHPCGGGKGSWRRTLKARTVGSRAARVARKLDTAMRSVGGNLARAARLRARYDVVTTPLKNQKRQSFFSGLRSLFAEGAQDDPEVARKILGDIDPAVAQRVLVDIAHGLAPELAIAAHVKDPADVRRLQARITAIAARRHGPKDRLRAYPHDPFK
jgi:hypothetical protein